MLVGTALTAILWPALGIVAADAPREGARLTTDLGWPLWVVVAGITTLGVIASMVARRFERRPGATAIAPWWRPTTLESVSLTLAFAFAFANERPALAAPQVAAIAEQIAREEDHVDPLDLAEMIRDRRDGLRIVDVREGLDSSTYVIPGAETVPLDELITLAVSPRDHLVLYSDGGAHAAQAWVLLRARGLTDVKVLKDGMAAWEDEVLEPAPPAAAEDTAQRRFKRARDLSLWFGGHVRLEPVPDESAPPTAAPAAAPFVISPRAKDALPAPRKRRRNTC
jgi:rhodanese-related sulfurtransferase